MEEELSWENRRYYLSKVPHTFQVMFALHCAKQVMHLAENIPECKAAIEVTERWLENKAATEELLIAHAANANAAHVAYAAAYAAAHAANANAYAAAAYAAYAAANAAYYAAYYAATGNAHATTAAANAAYHTANAAAYAYTANAAAYATYATYAAAYAAAADAAAAYADNIKQEQVEYLREFYLDSLPEEERNCWLVQACL